MFHQQEIAVGNIAWLIYDHEENTSTLVFDEPYEYKYNSQYNIKKIVFFEIEE